MNRKKILQLLLATSAIASTIGFTTEYVQAAEQTTVQASQNSNIVFHNIMGNSEASKAQMISYFKALNVSGYKLPVSIDDFVSIAYEEAQTEGVRGDIVVAQSFLETGYFRYGNGNGIVQAEDNNFAGLGAVSKEQSHCKFNDVREGLRAQVQHLKAYASTNPLVNAKVDPRFDLVARGSAKTLEELGGKWAYPGYDTTAFSSFEQALTAGNTYGQRIYYIIEKTMGAKGTGTVINNTSTVSNTPATSASTTTNTSTSSTNSSQVSQATSEKGQVVNVSTNLRMRQSPSTDSAVLAYLNNGQTFDIKGKSGDWYQVSLNGKLGYIHKDYVKEITSTTTVVIVPTVTAGKTEQVQSLPAAAVQAKGQVINVSSSLRMRQGANIGSAVIGYLISGQTFDIKEKNGDWYYISDNGKLGYIHKDYVKEISGTPEVTQNQSSTNTSSSTNVSSNTKSGSTTDNNSSTNIQSQNNNSKYESAKGQVINVSSSLRMRQGANIGSVVIGYLRNGQTFDIKEKNGDWYYISDSGKQGYVHKDYVKEISGTPETTQTSSSTNTNTSNSNQNSSSVSSNYNSSNNSSNTSNDKPIKGQVIDVSTSLRVRQNANLSSTVIGYLSNGETFDIKDVSGDWYYVQYGSKAGYVSKQYVKVTESATGVAGNNSQIGSSTQNNNTSQGTTTQNVPTQNAPAVQQPQVPIISEQTAMVYNVSTNLRVRSKASSDSSSYVVAYLLPNQTFKIIGSSGDWFNINANGKTGYVNKAYVKILDETNTSTSDNYAKIYEQVLQAMKSQVGTPYIYGGSGQILTRSLIDELKKLFPFEATSGMYNLAPIQFFNGNYRAFDCSGLMQWSFKQAGVIIGRTTYDQVNDGREVSKDEVRPGDLLLYSDVSHVGMYIGDGKWIEAPNSRSFVRIVDVPWNKIGHIRRIIN
ncbi:SH3 domain-containing protein [Clostridium sp. C8-1-8]|uniref:SH3 domain-containing protein n=1 Tax=Clostridium sp. C8-1-8 TaxID=2698831 RepID=UPI00136B8006|nr:SH3 domain-containing protein [Clostridium sp. C8-1-8]